MVPRPLDAIRKRSAERRTLQFERVDRGSYMTRIGAGLAVVEAEKPVLELLGDVDLPCRDRIPSNAYAVKRI